ncbi:hypothetical protein YH65_03415 [Sulfurovum lithotrophicum]|uniref:DUF4154 domain-containing protein n=1 Tax=Sulfurovum lithotrophicum TaxID=206403 RepID=A0A7U4M0F2_9BACT|nr:hypothetical protein [Sulfurovum lithotrophicum]AKF24544.1 hypothetical protein YH65_03415 [Sulfurovum lithotrophicum]
MIRILLFLSLLYGHLYAWEKKSTLQVYRELLTSLAGSDTVKIYTADPELHSIFARSHEIKIVNVPEASDIIIVSNENAYERLHDVLQRNKQILVFATDYHLLKDHAGIIGALYWKKGRSQLLFIDSRLKEHHIELPQEYRPFIVESL